MTIFTLVANHPENGAEAIAAFKHDPTSEEIREAIASHVRHALYDDSEHIPVVDTDEIKQEISEYDGDIVAVMPIELWD